MTRATIRMDEREHWYRYREVRYAPHLDEYDQIVGDSTMALVLDTIPIARHTPQGVQLDMGCGETRFVLTSARKRYACPTKLEAKFSFLARKRRQLVILMAQTDRVKEAISIADKMEAV